MKLSAHIEFDEQALERLADLVDARLGSRAATEPESWLDVKEAAAYLSCSKDRIYELVSRRKGDSGAGLEFRKDGSRLVFRREWLDAVLGSS